MLNEMNNMTFPQYIKSYFHLTSSFNRYRKTYKNYLSVMRNLMEKKFPIHATLRNGTKVILENYYQAYLTSFGIMDEYKIQNNIITIFKKNSSDIEIDLGNDNGDVYAVFFEEVYDFLPVNDEIVIDIGANIGDSSIYFARKGAKKVIAIEPLPQNFQLAKKNIELNNFNDKVELLLSGCSDEQGFLTVDENKDGAGSNLKKSTNGTKIPLITLSDLISKYKISTAVLKLDCEGCEYDSILTADKSILLKFTHIQIEYHYGYKNLKEKLENCGFTVTVTDPYYIKNKQAGKSMFYGYLYAKRS
jgi:FkbM family methyltransferase